MFPHRTAACLDNLERRALNRTVSIWQYLAVGLANSRARLDPFIAGISILFSPRLFLALNLCGAAVRCSLLLRLLSCPVVIKEHCLAAEIEHT